MQVDELNDKQLEAFQALIKEPFKKGFNFPVR